MANSQRRMAKTTMELRSSVSRSLMAFSLEVGCWMLDAWDACLAERLLSRLAAWLFCRLFGWCQAAPAGKRNEHGKKMTAKLHYGSALGFCKRWSREKIFIWRRSPLRCKRLKMHLRGRKSCFICSEFQKLLRRWGRALYILLLLFISINPWLFTLAWS